jgi:hypothetical protein
LARDFSSSRRAPPNATSNPCASSACLQRLRLHDVGVQRRPVLERIDAGLQALAIDVHDQLEPMPSRGFVAEGDHVAELPRRVDVQQGERESRRG